MSTTIPTPTASYQPDTRPAPGSAPPVDLLRKSAVDDDPTRARFLRTRGRQVSILNLAMWMIVLIRDLAMLPDPKAQFRIPVWLAAIVVQSGLVALAWSRLISTARRATVLTWVNLAVLTVVVAGGQVHIFSQPELTQLVFTDKTRATLGVWMAIGWVAPWYGLILGLSVLFARSWRECLWFGLGVGVVPVGIGFGVYAVNDVFSGADLRLILIQSVLYVLLAIVIAVYSQYRFDTLQREAEAAKRFGQYRLIRKLDAGGMGEVHLAEHLLLKRPSVIKLVRSDKATDPMLLARFEREVRMLATLTHPNTVAVFDYGHTTDGAFYYVMEYLPGLDLSQLVGGHGTVPPGRVVHLLRQVCAALREAHAAGLVHRDVKPSNVMLCERGGVPDVIKLLDFGLVQAASGPDRLTTQGSILGTPHYMSPEQAGGLEADHRSDLYSLGAAAYYLLTGRPPFERATMMLTLAAHLTAPVIPPSAADPAIPADLEAVVLKCLEKKPEDRFATARELDAALGRCACAADWNEDHAAAWWAARSSVSPGCHSSATETTS